MYIYIYIFFRHSILSEVILIVIFLIDMSFFTTFINVIYETLSYVGKYF